jgi:PAS domain-containing protein
MIIRIFGAILGSAALAAVLYALTVLAQFGRKLGAVTKMRPYYRGYYVAIVCVGLALITRLLRASVFWAEQPQPVPILSEPLFQLLLYHLPLAIGLTASLVVTWHYWSWLLKER